MKKKADQEKQAAKKKTQRSGGAKAGGERRTGGSSRSPGSAQRARLEKELKEAIGQIDEEGLLFLLQQSQILLHNARVDELNRELAELRDRQGAGSGAASRAQPGSAAGRAQPGSAAGRAQPASGAVSIEESESGKAFFLTLGATRKVLNLEEMRRLVRICYAAETKSDALRQLYTVFSRERGDVLADAKIASPSSPLIEGLFYAIRNSYQLKDR